MCYSGSDVLHCEYRFDTVHCANTVHSAHCELCKQSKRIDWRELAERLLGIRGLRSTLCICDQKMRRIFVTMNVDENQENSIEYGLVGMNTFFIYTVLEAEIWQPVAILFGAILFSQSAAWLA